MQQQQQHKRGLFKPASACLSVLVVVVSLLISQQARCETKEFDWSELGVSLASPKSSLGGSSSASNNLRILVSPQRRMTKNYEFEYTNNSQPISAETSSFVIPGAGSGSYLTQSALSPNHSGHSSAYSALSASLASLKNRLSARGVTLSSSLADTGPGQAASLYSNSGYSASLLDSTGGQQHHSPLSSSSSSSSLSSSSSSSSAGASSSVSSQQNGAGQSQPTYLSVSSPQEPQPASTYAVGPSGQASDNKTIVLAIPAKINFLTGSKQQQQQQIQQHQQQQQPQQVTLIQSSDGQQTRAEYGPKQQLGVLNGQELIADQNGQLISGQSGDNQEHHQYVIVNSPAPQNADYHSHSVAASLSPSPVQTIYSSATIYQPAATSGASAALKYAPATYTQPLTTVVQQQQQQPKYYSMIEQSQPVVAQQQVALSPAAAPIQAQPVYESIIEQQQQQQQQQPARQMYSYSTCPDTCNSSDPRWRKYTVSKYKACCSRSSQYDSTFEQPSVDKVAEVASKYSDDAYYGYLYRKSRARRSRRQRAKYSQRYPHHQTSTPSSASSSSDDQEELRSSNLGASEPTRPDERPTRQYSGSSESSSSASSSSGSPYMKYYRSRHQNYPSEQLERDLEPVHPGSSGSSKYQAAKEARAYRRGRSRDLEASLEMPQTTSGNNNNNNNNEPNEDQELAAPQQPLSSSSSAYGRGSSAALAATIGSYGAGDYSVEGGSRYGSGQDEEESLRGSYGSDESIGSELDKNIDSDYASGEPLMEPADELSSAGGVGEPEAGYNKYQTATGTMTRTRRTKTNKQNSRSRKQQVKDSGNKYYTSNGQPKRANRNKNKYNAANIGKSSEISANNNGTTDYDSAQAGDYHTNSSSSSSSDSNDEYESSSGKNNDNNNNNNNNSENLEAEKDAIAAKYKSSFNETAVANLSKTTMHLKEILSLLEKKAQYTLQANGNGNNGRQNNANDTASQSSNGSPPVTSTPSPLLPIMTTTTSSLYPMSSLFGPGSLSSSSSSYPNGGSLSPSDYLTSELSMKTPYRYEPSLSSSLGSSLSLPSSFGSLGASDSFGISSYGGPSHGFGLHPSKPLPMMSHGGHGNSGMPSGPHHPRKRRVNKNSMRYNELMLQKAAHGLGITPSFLHAAAAKNRFLNQAYYPTLQHPYLYRGSSPTITNPYPYKNIHKNPYSSLFNGPVSSKLASSAAASLYSDDSRASLHGLAGASNYDPLSNVASSLRPSTTMRLRTKPFVFQPQVLPIYSRHTILTQPLDVKA